MRLAWAIICSFVLAGTPFLLEQKPMSDCAKHPVPACCHHGCNMPCCKANPASNSQSIPAVPAQTGGQNQFSLLAAGIVAWVLPEAPITPISSDSPSSFVSKGSPLYARNCAWLI